MRMTHFNHQQKGEIHMYDAQWMNTLMDVQDPSFYVGLFKKHGFLAKSCGIMENDEVEEAHFALRLPYLPGKLALTFTNILEDEGHTCYTLSYNGKDLSDTQLAIILHLLMSITVYQTVQDAAQLQHRLLTGALLPEDALKWDDI